MDNRNRNILFGLFAAVLALSVAAAVVFLMITENEAGIHNSEKMRLETYMLADELRQSSDDLTRMARLYTVTGDARYKDYFETILDIRSGAAPRPERYGGIYWDLVVDTGQKPRGDGKRASLMDLATTSGYTGAETALFVEAERNSLALAELEHAALDVEPSVDEAVALAVMAAIEDEDVENLLSGGLSEATFALHGAEYNRRKAEVMRPIDRLLASLDVRHDQAVNDGESTRYTLTPILLAALGLAALLSVGAIVWMAVSFRRGG